MSSLELGEHVVVDVLQVRRIVRLGQLLIDAALQRAQVLRLEEL